MPRLTVPRFLLLLLAGAIVGFTIFGVLVYRAVDVSQAPASEARRAFDEVRASFAGAVPMLEVDAAGRVVRRAPAPPGPAARPRRLRVLAYHAADERLVRADVPFWFFQLKGPAIQFALAGTGLDLEKLGVTPSDLAKQGPCLVLDQTATNGDRLLVWTE